MPRSKPRKPEHSADAVRVHMAARHPSCPPLIVETIAEEIRGRLWSPPVTLGEAVGIVASNHVRHRLTDYERLTREGVSRDEARRLVAPDVVATLASWARVRPRH